MTLDLAAIRARVDAATPGPWEADPAFDITDSGPLPTGPLPTTVAQSGVTAPTGWVWRDGGCDYDDYGDPASHADATFIAAAREDVPALLAEVERLRAELDRYREEIRAALPDEYQLPGRTYLALVKEAMTDLVALRSLRNLGPVLPGSVLVLSRPGADAAATMGMVAGLRTVTGHDDFLVLVAPNADLADEAVAQEIQRQTAEVERLRAELASSESEFREYRERAEGWAEQAWSERMPWASDTPP